MNEWQGAPIFGARSERERYTVRPSAYGLIEDGRGQIALVRTPQGIFLPGGGIDAGETATQAVVREAQEECGFLVRVGTWATFAVQFCFSESEKTHFEKRCTFVDAVFEATAPAKEADHELVWMAFDAASAIMAHESHGWAITAWRNRRATP